MSSQNPTSQRPQPPFPSQQQEPPGLGAAQPAELAPVYVLLASQDGSYISGAVIPVTGGQPVLP